MIQLALEMALAFVVLFVCLTVVPNPVRANLRALVRIKARNVKEATTTPVEREIELLAGPKEVIANAQGQLKSLEGRLLHQKIVRDSAGDDLRAAEETYFKATTDGANDGAEDFLVLVAEKEQELAIEQQTCDSLEQAVATACGAIRTASRELRALQLKVKSDEARELATQALTDASRVIESAQTLTATGGQLNVESRAVTENFERAQAQFEGTQGTPVERELRTIKQQEMLDDVRKRLEERRAARTPQ